MFSFIIFILSYNKFPFICLSVWFAVCVYDHKFSEKCLSSQLRLSSFSKWIYFFVVSIICDHHFVIFDDKFTLYYCEIWLIVWFIFSETRDCIILVCWTVRGQWPHIYLYFILMLFIHFINLQEKEIGEKMGVRIIGHGNV